MEVEDTTTPAVVGEEELVDDTAKNRRKVPVKPALKSNYNTDEDDDVDMNEAKPKAKSKKKKSTRTLKWDEAKIQEHDQLRGTRMKIEEANTPFAYYDSGSETDGSFSSAKGSSSKNKKSGNEAQISWDALTNKLEAHAAVKEQYPPSSPSSHGGHTTDDEETAEAKREHQRKELKRLEFKELRKRHYNEMEVLRRFRQENPGGEPTSNGHHDHEGQQHQNDDDDDDEDNDGDDENE